MGAGLSEPFLQLLTCSPDLWINDAMQKLSGAIPLKWQVLGDGGILESHGGTTKSP